MPEIPAHQKWLGSTVPFPTLILLEPKLRNLRFSRLLNASMGIESKKLNDRSSSTRLVSSESGKQSFWRNVNPNRARASGGGRGGYPSDDERMAERFSHQENERWEEDTWLHGFGL